MADLAMTVPTFEDRVRVIVPVTVTSDVVRLGHDIADSIDLAVTCRFQLCDEVACGLPPDGRCWAARPA